MHSQGDSVIRLLLLMGVGRQTSSKGKVGQGFEETIRQYTLGVKHG